MLSLRTESSRVGRAFAPRLPLPYHIPVWLMLILLFLSVPVRAQDHLLFCNTPERLRMTGNCATARLTANQTYTIFYHYRNGTSQSGRFHIRIRGGSGALLHATIRKGIADPQNSPVWAGRQAMARFLGAGAAHYRSKGSVSFDYRIASKQVASGVLTVSCNQAARLDLYFGHNRYPINGAKMLSVDSPHRTVLVTLSPHARRQSVRIGESDKNMSRYLDGAYGLVYAIKVVAPTGRRVRVSFSPRGGRSGLVCSINGSLCQSDIVNTAHWSIVGETKIGKKGLTLTTAPFAGVFYPVELVFQLI